MGIRFQCPHCQGRLHVKAFLAGKLGICPQCGGQVQIPAEDVPVAAAAGQRTARSAPAKDVPARTAAPAPTASGVSRPTEPDQQPPAAAAVRDSDGPWNQDPDAYWYVRTPAGGQYGPAQGPVMGRWVAEGRVSPEAHIWREGWADWRLAADVLGSFPPAAEPPQGPPPPPSVAKSGRADAGNLPPPSAAAESLLGPAGPERPSVASAALAEQRYLRRRRGRRGLWTAAVVLLGTAALVLLVVLVVILQKTT